MGSAIERALDAAHIETQNVRVIQYPNTAAGFNLVSDGAAAANAFMAANVQFVAVGTIANPIWIVGISLGLPVVQAIRATISIHTALAAAELARIDVGTNLFPVAEWFYPFIKFPGPWGIKVVASPLLAFNIRKDTGASLAGFNNCHLVAVTGVN